MLETDRSPRQRRGPLAGLVVADFCWMGVGAVATRMLADFGADVIKIEDRKRLDMPRRLPFYKGEVRTYGEEDPNPDPDKGGLFNNYNRNKLGVTIDMRTERGRAVAERLIAASSVVTENFAPGVMERWGLTYEHLRELRSDVIYARMSGYGHRGPHMEYRSYGPVIQAVSGLTHISGLPGREPSGWGFSYMDNQAAYYNSAAIMMGVLNRDLTGEGTLIDVSAVEVGINLIGPDLLDVAANHTVTRRPDFPTGNRLEHPQAAPHGVYPAAGEDRWIAIAVFDDADWKALTGAIGDPEWSADSRFATQADRFANQDAIDKHLSAITREQNAHELMHRLQAAGVTAGAVQNPQDLDERDPQLAHRETFFDLDHPVIGEARFEGSPVLFSRTEQDNWRSAPLLGEDNQHVFTTLLGMPSDEVAELTEEGIL